MKRAPWIVATALATALGSASADELPHLQSNGDAVQLMVDDAPYLILGGELHNSSPSSALHMAPIWDHLARNHVRTVIGAASWELVEPQEGRFDFAAVDDQIRQAQARGMHIVLIWFAAYKNAESTYAPSWVRRDEARFPRAMRDANSASRNVYAGQGPILSVFNDRLADADARAFAALMHHIRQVDRHRTVIMMQVENEVGLLGDSRDRSSLADAAWAQQVPAQLINYLREHRATLRPWLAQVWARQGFRESGTWAEVFGTDWQADEVFMAWGFGRFVEQVAAAGAAEYKLPMYANAWLGPQAGQERAGQYPSGGPVGRMMDVWKAAAPSLALLAPDIYVADFNGTLQDYHTPHNPIFIPEGRFSAGNLFVALAQHNAIAFSPFGIEDGVDDNQTFRAYGLLNEMVGVITQAQAEGRIRGFAVEPGGHQVETLGGYQVTINGGSGPGFFAPGAAGAASGPALQALGSPFGNPVADQRGYGLIISVAPDEFLIVGQNVRVDFAVPNARIEIDRAEEGRFANNNWIAGRVLNGDERYALFPANDLRVVRVKLLRR